MTTILQPDIVVGCLTDNCHALWDAEHLHWIKGQLVHYQGTTWCETDLIDKLRKRALKELTRSIREPIKNSLLCSDQQGDNYYHFLIEVFPKLLTLHHASIEHDFNYTNIILSNLPKYAQELLKLSKIKRCKINIIRSAGSFHSYTVTASKPLLLNEHRPKHNLPERIRLIHNALNIEHAYPAEPPPAHRKLFIERRVSQNHCSDRHIQPREAFHNFIESLGYTIIYPESLSVHDQIQLFRSASVVAGVHGAGLSNLIFMHPSAKVIEIRHQRASYPFFRNLAQAAGISYEAIRLNGSLSIEEENHLFHPELLFNRCPLQFDPERLRGLVN